MRRLLSTYFVIVILLAGCVEEVDLFQPLELNSGNIDRFFEAAQSNAVQSSWDASQEQLITLPGYGRVIVPPNALVSADGAPVSGTVQAKVLEFYSKGDYLRNGLTTLTPSGLIQAAGTLSIDIRQGDQRLSLAPDQLIKVQMASARYNSMMRVFSSFENEANGAIEWKENGLVEAPVRSVEVENTDTGEFMAGFEFSSPRLGKLLCGFYIPEVQGLGEVCINLPYHFEAQNTRAFIVLRDYNSLAALPFTGELNRPDCCRNGLPIGKTARIVVVSEGGDETYFLGQGQVIIAENLTISITPERAELSDIMLALDGL